MPLIGSALTSHLFRLISSRSAGVKTEQEGKPAMTSNLGRLLLPTQAGCFSFFFFLFFPTLRFSVRPGPAPGQLAPRHMVFNCGLLADVCPTLRSIWHAVGDSPSSSGSLGTFLSHFHYQVGKCLFFPMRGNYGTMWLLFARESEVSHPWPLLEVCNL